jgi:hypothetical protein
LGEKAEKSDMGGEMIIWKWRNWQGAVSLFWLPFCFSKQSRRQYFKILLAILKQILHHLLHLQI